MEHMCTLASLRERSGFTQTELSALLGEAFGRIGSYKKITRKSISAWETGRHIPQLAPDETRAVCKALQCTLDELASATQTMRQHQSEAS